MRHIKLFESFKLDDSRLDVANDILTTIFGPAKGKYDDDKYYSYGQTYDFEDGTSERGYVTSYTILGKENDGIALKYVPKAALDELFTLFPKDKIKKLYSLCHVSARVNDNDMITSKRNERTVTVWLGPSRGGNFSVSGGKMVLNDSNYKTAAKTFQDNIKEASSKITGKDLIRVVFEDMAWHELPVKKDQSSGGKSSHVGIGRHASTKVHYDIKKGYDISKYLKKYGEDKLMDAMGGTYFKKRFFRGIENGLLLTDESWTDTHD